jgi:predicted RNase H-like HicB family nuclease
MNQFIIVRNGVDGRFSAHVPGVPELEATGSTREEAVEQVRHRLHEWVSSGQLVPIDLPEDNPWIKYAGWAKDDPDYDVYLEELAKAKKEDLERTLKEYEQECPNSSSTPTT